MLNDFSQLTKITKIYATNIMFEGRKASKEEITKDIEKVDLERALIILSRLSILDDEGIENLKLNIFKNYYGQDDFNKIVLISPDAIFFTMKWFLAYGVKRFTPINEITKNELLHVLHIILKLSDHIDIEDSAMSKGLKSKNSIVGKIVHDNRRWLDGQYTDAENKIFRSSLQKTGKVNASGRALVKQHIMFEKIARTPDLFPTKEFLDIHSAFEQEYGYSIKEYVSVVFMITKNCWSQISIDQLLSNAVERDPHIYFRTTTKQDTANQIWNELTVDPLDLKSWAQNTLNNSYDHEAIQENPLFMIKNKIVCSSPMLMENLLFEGLIYKIAKCFRGTRFFDFYGRIFEEYVNQTLASAVENSSLPYKFIKEFSYGKENKASSDAYLKLGKSLLIFECKSGRVSKRSKLQGVAEADDDYKKYVIEPLEQARDAYEAIKKSKNNKIGKINKVFVIAVSGHAFPKVIKYQEDLESRNLKQGIKEIKIYDYIGLETIENFASFIENYDKSIFKLLRNKFNQMKYLPYDSFFWFKNYDLWRPNWHDEMLGKLIAEMAPIFGVGKEEDVLYETKIRKI